MDTLTAIHTRRSIREYQEKDIPEELVLDLLKAAMASPSARNQQPWEFVVITDPDLRNEIRETVALEVWAGSSTIMAYRAEALRLRRAYLLRPGDRVDVHVSAGARVILPFLAPHVVDRVLQGPFERYTENSIVDPAILREQIKKAGRDGFAISRGERHPDSNIMAVPIFDYEKRPVAAISLFTTTEALPKLLAADIISKLKEASNLISAKLLYSEEPWIH